MNKKHKIIYFPLFYEDLDNITDYIKNKLKNEIALGKFVDKLEKEIKERASNPISYEEYISNKKRKNKYYRIYVDNFTVFYTVKNNVMEVRRILYSKRNFNKLIWILC